MTALADLARARWVRGQTRETLVQRLANVAPFPFVLTRVEDQTVVLINERAAELFRISPTDAVGRYAPDFYCDPSRRAELIDRLRRDGAVADYATDLRDAEGNVFPALLSAALLDYAGQTCLAVTVNNVERQVRAEAALSASEARFRRFAEATFEGILEHIDGRIVEANSAASRLFGYPPDELRSMTVERLLTDGSGSELRRLLESHSEERLDCFGLRVDGSQFPIRLTLKAPHGADRSRLIVVRDLSERRAAEEALRRSEMRFRLLVENLRDLVFYRGQPDGTVLLFGRDVQSLAGTRNPDGTANLEKWYASIHPDDLPRYLELEHRRRTLGEGFTIDFRIRHAKTGVERWVRERAYVVKDPETGEQFNDGYIMDIGEEKAVQEQLRAAKEEAEVANRTKTLFLANMSHELRTPLNAIIGFSEVIQAEVFGPVGSERYLVYAKDIRDSGKHLLEIINDILDLAKIEVGKFELHEEDCDISSVIQSALRFVRDRAHAAGLSVNMQLAPDLPMVRADQRALKQILLNLLSNAIKFTPLGGKIEIGADLAEDGRFALWVSDTGIGMAPEDVPRALEAFGQIDNSLSRKYDGTGLGLPLVKAFAELHGGTIEIDSTRHVGTTIRVFLPAERILHPSR